MRRLSLLIGVLVIAGLLVAGRSLAGAAFAALDEIRGRGALAPLAFVALYAFATVAFVPGSLLTLAAGAIFGLLQGTLVALAGATLGASAAFLLARHAVRGLVERKVRASPRLAALDAALAAKGRMLVFLLRLSPVFPFNVLNYVMGITRVGFRDYLIASIGMLPGTLLYVYYGRIAGDLARVAAGGLGSRGVEYYVLLGVGLVATIAATVLITRAARRALAGATPELAR